MKTTPKWRRYLRFWRPNVEHDVEDELRFHTEMRIREFMSRGMTEDDARRAVFVRLGDVDAARAECVELGHVRETHARQADFLDGLRADVRYALRSLARAPGWTAVALLTIAFGVGATTTVFSVADALLVRPFAYRDASRVYMARRQFTVDGQTVPVSLPFGVSRVWREHAQTIEGAALAGSGGSGALGSGADTVTVHAAHVDPEFLDFAGATPVIGRNPRANEITTESNLLLLTEQFWRRQYGASSDVIGKVVRFQGRPHRIVGVVPASLSIPDFRAERADVIELIAPGEPATGAVLVRLKPSVTRQAATDELETIMKHAQLKDVRPVPMEMPLRLTRPGDWLAIRQPLVMLTGAVALLLLVACTNLAHLLLARGAARQRELAVRHALGAGRARLLRQLVTESVVIAVIGGALAVFVGWAGLHLLAALRPATLGALTYVSADRRVVAITAVLAIGAGLAIGLLAALRIAHRDLGLSLRAGALAGPLAGRRLRSLLVVAEVALSATLLVGALLLVHAVYGLQHSDLGFDATGVYALRVPVERGTTATATLELLRERAKSIPGVNGITVAGDAPGGRGFRAIAAYETPDHPTTPEAANGGVGQYAVASDYFAMMRMPLVAGRSFDDGSAARNEVIVSRSVARQIAPDGNVIGLRVRNAVARSRGPDEPWQTVIGVVPDVVTSLVETSARLGFYKSVGAIGPMSRAVTLIVRLDGADGAARLAQFAAGIRPHEPKVEISSVRETIDQSLAEPRFTMRILAAFAALGVLLAGVGLFGVISYSVGQRTREIGVRMTLGATRASIARLVVGDGLRLAVAGVCVGLAGAVLATRLVQSLLYGVSRFDPFAFGIGAMLLLAVAVIACVVPMIRATGIDPAIAVRAD